MKSLLRRLAGLAGAWGVVLCLPAAALPTRGAEPVAEIPYRLAYQGWFTVDTSVNGTGPHDFIVDSGATITSVFANLAAQQEMPSVPGKSIQILGLTGAQELPAHEIGDIDFGGVALEDHIGVILPDWAPPNTPPQGVMGLDLLTRYDVHLDTNARLIRFYDPAVPVERRRRWSKVDMERFHSQRTGTNLFMIEVRINADRIPCIVDLGASGTIFNTAALEKMMPSIRHGPVHGAGAFSASRINDVFDTTDRARPIRVQRLNIGRARWSNKIFIVYDAKIFADLGYEKRPFCLVGADMFTDRSVFFDFAEESLYIGPSR